MRKMFRIIRENRKFRTTDCLSRCIVYVAEVWRQLKVATTYVLKLRALVYEF